MPLICRESTQDTERRGCWCAVQESDEALEMEMRWRRQATATSSFSISTPAALKKNSVGLSPCRVGFLGTSQFQRACERRGLSRCRLNALGNSPPCHPAPQPPQGTAVASPSRTFATAAKQIEIRIASALRNTLWQPRATHLRIVLATQSRARSQFCPCILQQREKGSRSQHGR
jgi:hypothetical protein